MPNFEGKTGSYSSFYSEFDMETMGYIFMWTYEKYIIDVDMGVFTDKFMQSHLRYIMEEGSNSRINALSSEEILDLFIEVDLNNKSEKLIIKKDQYFADGELQWIGMAYAYLHYRSDIRSRDLNLIMPFRFMRAAYITGHQLFFNEFYERCEWMINEFKKLNSINYEKETFNKFKPRKIPDKIQRLIDECDTD